MNPASNLIAAPTLDDAGDGLSTDAAAEAEAARRRVLARKLQQRRAASEAAGRSSVGAAAPLSFSQEGLWFLAQLDGASGAYHVPSATRLRGALDAGLLERCLGMLVARHDILRTEFEADGEATVQKVLPVSVALERLRLGRERLAPAEAPEAAEAALQARLQALAARPFDLSKAPLLRADLLQLGPDDHVLLLVVHHLAVDGWSMSILKRELAQLYAHGGDGGSLAAPALRFGDHAALERQRFGDGGGSPHASYWRDKLGQLQTLALPHDLPRPARLEYAGRSLALTIEPARTAALRALAARHHGTLFMALLAVFKVLLMRHAGQSDIAVGVPLAARTDARLHDVVGYFANTVVLRDLLDGEQGFPTLLAQVRRTVLEAIEHQDMPFTRVVAELAPERDAGRHPLFQVAFTMESFPHRALELDGLQGEAVTFPAETSKFDLSLNLTEAGDRLEAHFEYRSALFEERSIAQLAAHFRQLLAAVVADPECPLERLPLLDDGERRRVLVDWNHRLDTAPRQLAVPALFRARARAAPQAVALRCGAQSLRYDELDARSDRLAQALRRLGVGPDVVVGLCMRRCIGMAVGLLAVFKAQGVLLPLDPEQPTERLRLMLADAAPAVLLTQAALAGSLQAAGADPGSLQLLPDDGVLEPAEALAALPEHTPADALAYLIYTSGSTGTPKAAQLLHRGFANHVLWMGETLGLGPGDRVLQKTSVSFDAALWEFFSTWSSGATLVLVPPEAHGDLRALARLLREEAISVVQFVPSELRLMLEELAAGALPALRYVLSGGEALDRSLALAFRERLPAVRLGNFYGPTETSVDSSWYEVGPALPPRPLVPIGRPVANVRLYVLDRHLQPQPVNVAGDLYVAGAGVGRGYRGRPELTAASFVPDPFHPGETMYRSGDLARWLHDGVLEFVGRSDDQVKLRGLRIELGEIESALAGCPHVTGCAVLLREVAPGRKELVAYVAGPAAAAAAPLRAALRARLPPAMIPARFVFLEALPRLASGKLDRGRLPAPGPEAAPRAVEAPRSPIESALFDIWSHVLGKSGFGIRDNFFDLGGHSLLATQVVSRVRATLRIELPLRTLFEQPSIAQLAQAMDALAPEPLAGQAAALAPIEPLSRADALAVSFSQRRMWVLNQMDPHGAAYNMRDVLRLRGPLDAAALCQALDRLAANHEAFRTTFAWGEREPVARVGAVQPANVIHVDLSGTAPAEQPTALHQQAERLAAEPFDLTHGPLHRFILVRLAADDHALAMVMHHIIGDDWSWGVLTRELETLYSAALHQRPLAALPRSIDFVDYAGWQRRHIDDQHLAPQTAYWLRQLAGMSPLALAPDTAVAQRLTSQGDRIYRGLPAEWLGRVQQFGSRFGLTPFMTLLAAFQVLLARHCAQQDIVVGTPIAGRTRLESETLVGTLVNTLALRTQVRADESFGDLVQQVRETCLAAFSHQDIPFDYLMDRLHKQHEGRQRRPDVRVMFNVLNTPRQAPRLEGLQVSPVPLNLHATQFDLALTIDTEVEHSLALAFSTELFSPATAEALLDHFLHLVDQLMAQPGQPLHALWNASPHDLARLAAWNSTAVDHPGERTLPALLGAQRNAPGTALAQWPGEALDFTALWSRVDRLTHLLRARGVQRGSLVGLCLPRAPAMVVAQLAVLCAGAAYVPLDPAYPSQRLQDMATDAGLALLVTDSTLAPWWPEAGLPLLLLDRAEAELRAQPGGAPAPDPERDARPQDPAYVIYTSGSTGRPKGVVVPHRAVVNFLRSMQREPGLGPQDVLLAVTTLSFDIAVLELLLPLAVGATVALATREQAVDGFELQQLLAHSGATAMQATPSTWRLLIEAGWSGGPAFKAMVGGESLGTVLASQLQARAGAVWNLYGPTETTVWSTCWQLPPATATISIGRPIANTTVHVLDAHGQVCPVGVAGELFIGGQGVSLGYLDREALTAERFVPDRFGTDPQARLYRTGDRGRWRQDGLLEHQGRLDFQVKLRGHRIELGEIEARLQTHPAVSQCLALVREDSPGEARLVAYVVVREGAGALDGAALRDHLRLSLPDFMLPQHLVELPALPLLPNGKIDRQALPLPRIEPRSAAAADPAATPAERALAAIWAGLLGLEPDDIRRSDNFFDLGGDSLQVGRVIAALQRTCGSRLDARRMVFESLAQLAHGLVLGTGGATPAEPPQTGGGTGGWLGRLFGKGR